MRYASIKENHPICIICSQNGFIKWHKFSEDFYYKKVLGYEKSISPYTVAGEYYSKGFKYDSNKEEVRAKEWFAISGNYFDSKLYEKCIYSDANNLVFSVIWGD